MTENKKETRAERCAACGCFVSMCICEPVTDPQEAK